MRTSLLLLFLLFTALLMAQQPAAVPEPPAWLAGKWEAQRGATTFEEHWTTPVGGTMLSMARTIKAGKTLFFEYTRIEHRADGLYYVAQPLGRPATEFKAIEASGDHIVFANPQHDFPKRIIYRRTGEDTVTARTEGDGSEKEKPQDYHFRRVK